jgi:hypothetical protein
MATKTTKTKTKTKTQTQTKYVLVRTSGAGIHCGELVAREGTEVTLANARRIWRWDSRNDTTKIYTLSDVSRLGAGSGGRVSAPISEIIVLGAHEIISCSPEGERALRGAPPWQ